eukprot:scaffold23035_cov73-Cyclotella_meneghiniana.AAC.13
MVHSPKKTKSSHECRSIGEELYQVYLQRSSAPDPNPEENEDDHDLPHPRKLNRTIGEELFSVHLKRSQGMEPDYDGEKSIDDTKKTNCPYALGSRDKDVCHGK